MLITGNGVIVSLSALEEGSYILRTFHVPSFKWDFGRVFTSLFLNSTELASTEHGSTNQRLQNRASKEIWVYKGTESFEYA